MAKLVDRAAVELAAGNDLVAGFKQRMKDKQLGRMARCNRQSRRAALKRRDAFLQHGGNAEVVRQELAREKGVEVRLDRSLMVNIERVETIEVSPTRGARVTLRGRELPVELGRTALRRLRESIPQVAGELEE